MADRPQERNGFISFNAYGYDRNGNRTFKETMGGRTEYEYDRQGNLLTDNHAEYSYDRLTVYGSHIKGRMKMDVNNFKTISLFGRLHMVFVALKIQ